LKASWKSRGSTRESLGAPGLAGRFLVSRRLEDDFDNGEPYMPFNDQRIWMPGDPGSQPNREALEWHSDVCSCGEVATPCKGAG
jgi:hypothetical protein